MRDLGGTSDYAGHIDAADFLEMTTIKILDAIENWVKKRLEQILEYFYPLKDHPFKDNELLLKLSMGILFAKSGPFENVDVLIDELLERRVGKNNN